METNLLKKIWDFRLFETFEHFLYILALLQYIVLNITSYMYIEVIKSVMK